VRIRPYSVQDLRAIEAWHVASGFGYEMPNLSSPLFALLGVAESEGEMVAAAGIKLVGEAFYWQNPDARELAKGRAIYQLHKALHTNAVRQLGLDQVQAWVPPEIAGQFGPVLKDTFGWVKPESDWSLYVKNL
jgi:hypothetical protein